MGEDALEDRAGAAPARPPTLGLRHVALFVEPLEACTRFWTDVMGFVVEWKPDPDNVYLTSGRDNLALHRARCGPTFEQQLDHIGLAVARPDEVDAWASYLRSRGVRLEVEPRGHRDGARSLYFVDPAGIRVQIIFHAPLIG